MDIGYQLRFFLEIGLENANANYCSLQIVICLILGYIFLLNTIAYVVLSKADK